MIESGAAIALIDGEKAKKDLFKKMRAARAPLRRLQFDEPVFTADDITDKFKELIGNPKYK